ncbi:hypothetical protein E8E14_013344 [Neopestalotiopsis sp. 37M]|nr:hypothetical protein E8E14_013344 [Neopestalotiopsis sp. 37M]
MPVRTTTSNIQDHFQKFDLDKFPKTFRETVILCSELEIEYLWIDSLCIIQDDADDWDREASLMGSLYRNALLVVVAAGSNDSSEGLFIGDRPNLPSFSLPFYEAADDTQKYENISQAEIYHLAFTPPEQMITPALGPLAKRGWCLQEWHLARRRLSFMPGGMSWSCVQQFDERGYPLDLEMYSHMSWAHFLEDYTSRNLTYHADRLKAVEGVANEMKRGGREGYNYGLWADDCVPDLLWMPLQQGEEKDDLRDVPSWSWASTGSPKEWLLERMSKTSYEINSTTYITNSSYVLVTGKLLTVETIPSRDHDCCIAALASSISQEGATDEDETLRTGLLEKLLDEGYYGMPDSTPRRLLLGSPVTKSLRGLALVDKIHDDQDPISCILLASLHLGEFQSDEEKDSMCQDFPILHRDKASCLDFTQLNTAATYHLGLVIRPVDQNGSTFARL